MAASACLLPFWTAKACVVGIPLIPHPPNTRILAYEIGVHVSNAEYLQAYARNNCAGPNRQPNKCRRTAANDLFMPQEFGTHSTGSYDIPIMACCSGLSLPGS